MKRFFSVLKSLIIAFCVGTVLAQVIAFGMLGIKGRLDEHTGFLVLAALQGVDLNAIKERVEAAEEEKQQEQPSYDQILVERARNGLDFELRESAVENGVIDLISLRSELELEKQHFEQLKNRFLQRLEELETGERNTALQEVQRTLEVMQPRQAKEQLLRMMDDGAEADVVAIIQAMPIDSRKKIIAEFKDDEEADQLYRILNRIRSGDPVLSEIEDAREQLDQARTTTPRGSPTS